MNGIPIPYGLGALLGIGALVLSFLLILLIGLAQKFVTDPEHHAQLTSVSKYLLWLGVWFFIGAFIPDSVPTLLQLVLATIGTYCVLSTHKVSKRTPKRPPIEVHLHSHVVDSEPWS